jgi:hypothetical protein
LGCGGPQGGAQGKERLAAWLLRGRGKKETVEGRKAGWAKRRKGRGEKRFGVFLFKFFSNSFFKHHPNNKNMHSNHDAQALIISNII